MELNKKNEFPFNGLKVSFKDVNFRVFLTYDMDARLALVYTLLSELKVLSIRACPSVTPEGLLSVLALPYLQHLDYYTASPVPKSFIWGIAAQNPSLETISVNQGDSETDKEEAWSAKEKKDFFDKHPRIKALVNLVGIPLSAITIKAHFISVGPTQ